VYFYSTFQVKCAESLFCRAGYSLVLYDKFTLSLKTTEKEVAQLILNKDEKCIRQEILKFPTDDGYQAMAKAHITFGKVC
jgi:hypothetical protein